MVLEGEPPAKIFTVGLSYWRISKETYFELPRRGREVLPTISQHVNTKMFFVESGV
jgi:hypothetical protein